MCKNEENQVTENVRASGHFISTNYAFDCPAGGFQIPILSRVLLELTVIIIYKYVNVARQ